MARFPQWLAAPAVGTAACCLLPLTLGCRTLSQPDPLIHDYTKATCLPRATEQVESNNTRRWNHTTRLSTGQAVTVYALQAPGGRVELSFNDSQNSIVAVRPPDYVYPEDLRLDASAGILYVRASGIRAVGRAQLLLYEYDLKRREVLRQGELQASELPPICP